MSSKKTKMGEGMKRIIWMGQAGLLFETETLKIMIDPYLSNSVEKVNPDNFRRVPVNPEFFDITPDIMIFTHNHLDHYDPETVLRFINKNTKVLVLAPETVWNDVRKISGKNNFVLFNKHSVWTEKTLEITATDAEHSDKSAIGVIIDDGKKYYITGDTVYNNRLFDSLPENIYAVFLPVNGTGNNMNIADAKKFAARTGAKKVVPIHFGMFDEILPDGFDIIPEIYKEVKI